MIPAAPVGFIVVRPTSVVPVGPTVVPITSVAPDGPTTPTTHGPDLAHPIDDDSQQPLPTHPMVTHSKDATRKPKVYSATRHPLPIALQTQRQAAEPTSYTMAVKSSDWRATTGLEFAALQQNGIWSLVPFHPKMNVVGSCWVYKLKRRSDGSIKRYKARLVAKGFHQQEGINYTESSSPVAKPTTIRIVLSLAVVFKWQVRQLDVSNAFLHDELQEDVCMTQPKGFIEPQHPNHVCRLHKSLYGLNRARRACFKRVHQSPHLAWSYSLLDRSFTICMVSSQDLHNLFTQCR